jgi:enoyl-CoA hydratase/carnithine racemase
MVAGETFDFERARALGLVTEVLPKDGFPERVRAYAERFLPPGRASKAVGAIKRAVQSGAEMSMQDGLALERELQQQLFASRDAKEGIAAYVEQRKAAFEGR